MKRILGLLAAFALLWAVPAFAAPIPYYTGPNDVPNVMVNQAIFNVNAGFPTTQPASACTGTTTATCPGLNLLISTTGLSTAAGGTLAAAMTVTDTSVTASSTIVCSVNGYGGTGAPGITNIVPAAGTFTMQVINSAVSGALSATVIAHCLVYN
jgi:hypothetical protein